MTKTTQILRFLLGVMLTLVSIASALPQGTPTSLDKTTPASLGPRRNGHSDLPSSPAEYNAAHWDNRIPEFVMTCDEFIGSNAITYNQEEIYAALQQGYEVLQSTRDPAPNTGNFVVTGNVFYPSYYVDFPDELGLPGTFYGQYGSDSDSFDGVYIWPLTWTGSFTGLNQNPGDDRVIFNEDGVYLGVITRRPGRVSDRYHWAPPVTGGGRWVARHTGDSRGWSYTGVPPDGPHYYHRPAYWNVASNQRYQWSLDNPGGMAPIGSISAVDHLLGSPPPNATMDDMNDLLGHFPPMENSIGVWRADNSTGAWLLHVPNNTTENTVKRGIPSDCSFAADHGTRMYWHDCQSQWSQGAAIMKYRITISGTGQNTDGWCRGVMDNIEAKCGGNGHPQKYYSCNTKYPATVTWSTSTDPDDPGTGHYYYGIDMHFFMVWPWAESDADHTCVAEAIEAASCNSAGVQASNGKWCRNVYWVPDSPLEEWSTDMGPA